jgi:hypothetical protein
MASVAWPWPLAFPLHTGPQMTELITRSGVWLLQQGAALPDTLVMKTVAAERGWFDTVTGISSVIIALVLTLFVVFGAPAMWQVWQTLRKTRELVDKIHMDMGPLAINARALADRLGEFNALMKVFQDEAEATFVSTASTIRGVRSGASALRHLEDDTDDRGEDDDGDDESDEADEYQRGNYDDVEDDGRSRRPATRPRLRSHRRSRG